MNIHEYQAKQLLKKFGVPVLDGGVAYTPAEAESVAKSLKAPVYVVKAQIHAGGRGKGKFKEPAAGDKGGVRVVKTSGEVKT
ncbi:MAG: ATP-grasp domain-containing protein, partial [Rhodospirillaceae bacterium]